MSSLAFCLTLPTEKSQKKDLHKKGYEYEAASCNPQQKTQNNNGAADLQTTLMTINEKPNLLKRREAIVGGASSYGITTSILFLPFQFAEALEVTPTSCEFTASPSGLAFCDKIVGNGPQAVKGQLIKVHYIGRLENGKVFDNSYNRGKPLTFRAGEGEVIRGWDQGILGSEGVPPMLAGGKRTLMIPPELGYGIRGAGCRGGTCIIPPNSMLFFEVEFLGKV